jgi:hypothetical protein
MTYKRYILDLESMMKIPPPLIMIFDKFGTRKEKRILVG